MKGIIKTRMRYSFTPGKMAKIQNTDEGVKQQELLFTSDGNLKWYSYFGFPSEASGKEPTCQCRRHQRLRFDPWVRKIPWRRARQPTPAFLPGKSHGQRSLVGYVCRVAKSWTQLKRVNTQAHGTSLEAKKSLLMFHMYPSM